MEYMICNTRRFWCMWSGGGAIISIDCYDAGGEYYADN